MNSEPEAVRTFKMVLEYDGTDFHGWQVQPGDRTIQGEVENALKRLTGETVRIAGAGRTDAGVHALGQVASFRSGCRFSPEQLHRGLNGILPADVRILRVEPAERTFDARRNARLRVYRYSLAKKPQAVGRRYAWHPRGRFEAEPMIRASECLLGTHRWLAFCKKEPEERDYESELTAIRWETNGEALHFELSAVRFFHHMVRILMGTLLEVGRGKMTADRFRHILESQDRTLAGPTAPPHGLFLVRVEY